MASNEIVTKAEAARRWGLSKAAVTKYAHQGLPTRSDGKLNWPDVDRWRQRFVGCEPLAPAMAREAAKAVNQNAEEQAVETAMQAGRWAIVQALGNQAATARTIKVLIALGLSKRHAFYAAYWNYLGCTYADDITELDMDGAGRIDEPDWQKLFPDDKQKIDFEDLGDRLNSAFGEIFNPENNVWPDGKRLSIRQIMTTNLRA